MKRRPFRGIIIISVFTFLLFAANEPANAGIMPTVDGTVHDGLDSPKDGIPDKVVAGGIVQVLDVDRPTKPFEDRGIIEFNITSLSQPVTDVDLVLNVFDSMGPYPFTVDVFTYAGDGLLSLSDFSAGSLYTSFAYSGQSVVTLDVTPFIGALQTSGDNFAGFNFQFAVPTTIAFNGPYVAFNSLEFPRAAQLTIRPIPVPGAVVLASIGLGLAGWVIRRKES